MIYNWSIGRTISVPSEELPLKHALLVAAHHGNESCWARYENLNSAAGVLHCEIAGKQLCPSSQINSDQISFGEVDSCCA